MYIHKSIDYGINIRWKKKPDNTQTYTMTYKKKKINKHTQIHNLQTLL